MSDYFASVAGHPVQKLELEGPSEGLWFVDAFLAQAQAVTGRVEVKVGGITLSGTVVPEASGSFTGARRVRVVAGAGGWLSHVGPKFYHNDAGVRAYTVVRDLAQEVGETLGSFAPGAEKLGADWVRRGGLASSWLERAVGGACWWVGYDGVTHVGTRSTGQPSGPIHTLSYDPRARRVMVEAADPAYVGIGTILTDRLDEPQTVHGYRVIVDGRTVELECWVGGEADSVTRIGRTWQAIARKAQGVHLLGKYRYRVTHVIGERFALEPVRGDLELPSIPVADEWPGVGWLRSTYQAGNLVLVEFLDDGDPNQPAITGAEPLGKSDDPAIARVGDTVKCLFPPAVVTGTINGVGAFSGAIFWSTPYTLGSIQVGSGKATAAT